MITWSALLVVVGLVACSDSNAGEAGTGTTGSAGTTGGGGTAGAAGTTGAAGTAGGRGGTGGVNVPACPSAPPPPATSCTDIMQCHYEDCATFGQIVSVCNNGVFMQLSGPCVSASCEGTHGTSCPAGQICVEHTAGARIRQCMPNTCGAGPITCDCLGVACPGSCRITGAPGAGTFALCNNCPSGTCP